ncbi:MAG: peptide deformylase, partial [Clostridia bacterium]|nr:peptide deformylase [Clostridia bacterium]
MALRNIVKEGDEILHKKCRPVEKFDKKLATIIDDMIETMYKADGCGLAAPQVGLLRRIVVIDVGEGPIELVNPVIVERSGEQEAVEACLSIPETYGVTRRPAYVKVQGYDRNGDLYEYEGEELLARAFCHELDHLDGILFT